jgi:non-homologous end joining protein Ku
MVAIAETIVEHRSGAFEPASFGDRYQDALRELVEAKTKGLATTPRAIAEPPKVINLMEALKRRLGLFESSTWPNISTDLMPRDPGQGLRIDVAARMRGMWR